MSDQHYPDGAFADAAVKLAREILNDLEKKKDEKTTREEYLKTVAQAVRALQGKDP